MHATICPDTKKLWLIPRVPVSAQKPRVGLGITLRPGDEPVGPSTLTWARRAVYAWVRRDGVLTLVSLGTDEARIREMTSTWPKA